MKARKRVALYARVSTDGQSVENQIQELEAVGRKEGWQIVQRCVDKGISGALLDRGAEKGAPPAVLPSWAYRETTPNGNPRIQVDDPNFINQYKQQPTSERSTGHRELP